MHLWNGPSQEVNNGITITKTDVDGDGGGVDAYSGADVGSDFGGADAAADANADVGGDDADADDVGADADVDADGEGDKTGHSVAALFCTLLSNLEIFDNLQVGLQKPKGRLYFKWNCKTLMWKHVQQAERFSVETIHYN